MIQLNLDWREVLWWMQGGMAGSHLRWSVYEDMVNYVWPQATEQERRNMWLIMRRDLGSYWRPDGWNGHSHMTEKGEGPWRTDISDLTAHEHFRQVLARFDPDNQFAVTVEAKTPAIKKQLLQMGLEESAEDGTFILRTYRWQNSYRIDWSRRVAEDMILDVEQMEIPDDGTM